jgi:hypothetical protein
LYAVEAVAGYFCVISVEVNEVFGYFANAIFSEVADASAYAADGALLEGVGADETAFGKGDVTEGGPVLGAYSGFVEETGGFERSAGKHGGRVLFEG